jgi:hypothetical protein
MSLVNKSESPNIVRLHNKIRSLFLIVIDINFGGGRYWFVVHHAPLFVVVLSVASWLVVVVERLIPSFEVIMSLDN